MENLNLKAFKQTYEPPKAIFIPLKIEERLLACELRATFTEGTPQCTPYIAKNLLS